MQKRFVKRIVPILLMLVCASAVTVGAQTLMDQLFFIKDLIYQDKGTEALELLNQIEGECLQSDNDTIKLLFNESKGSILCLNNNFDASIPYMERVPALYESLHIKDVNYVEAYLALGMAYQKRGDYKTAERNYRRGLLSSVTIPNAAEYQSSFYLNLGNMYKEKGDSLLAYECFKRIDSKNFGQLMDAGSSDLIETTELQALEYRKNGESEKALPIYERLIARTREILGTHNEEYARLLYNKGMILGADLGRYNEALPIYKEVINLAGYLPICDENVLYSFQRYLQILAYNGDAEELNSMFPEVVERFRNCKSDYASVGMLVRMVGNGAYWAKRYELAIPYYELYLKEAPAEVGNSFIEIPNMLSVCYILTNQPLKAEEVLSNLMTKHIAALESNSNIYCTVLHNYGRSIMLLGNYGEAIPYFEKANALFRSIYGQDNPKTLEYLEECKRH